MLDLEKIKNAAVVREPFEFFTIENVLGASVLADINQDFPNIRKPGIYPLSTLTYGSNFRRLIEAVNGSALRQIMEEKFSVNLKDLPLMITVRGHCQKKDGRIHSDSKDKIVTCLLYLNEEWEARGGRLRLLRGASDIEDYLAEVPPHGGSFVAFKVSPHSWHGHEPFVGKRRYIMFNWVRSEDALHTQLFRHRLSAFAKKLFPFFYKGY